MKRLITIAVALFAAVAAQAASIDWALVGTGSNALKGQSGSNLTGATIYLVLASEVGGITEAIVDGLFSSSTKGVLDSAINNTNTTVSDRTATHSSLVAGNSYQYTLLVFNENYTGVVGSSGFYKFSEPGGPVRVYVSGEEDASSVSFASGPDLNGKPWVAYTIVPEPTAMALLALGAAAVGLRRRFRK